MTRLLSVCCCRLWFLRYTQWVKWCQFTVLKYDLSKLLSMKPLPSATPLHSWLPKKKISNLTHLHCEERSTGWTIYNYYFLFIKWNICVIFTVSIGDSDVVSVLPLDLLKGVVPQVQPVIVWYHCLTSLSLLEMGFGNSTFSATTPPFCLNTEPVCEPSLTFSWSF